MASPSLLDLPNELLCEIISYFQGDRQFLLTLSRLSLNLHVLTQRYLYRYADYLSVERQMLFKRTLEQHPPLRQAVHACGPLFVDEHGKVTKSQFEDFSSFANLKRFQICLSDEWPGFDNFMHNFLDAENLSAVRDVTISDFCWNGLPNHLLRSVMQLPTVQTFTLANIANGLIPRTNLVRPYHQGVRNNITSLGLGGVLPYQSHDPSDTFGMADLAILLDGCASLKKLNCTDLFVQIYQEHTVLYRHGLNDSLRIVADTLEDLTLIVTNQGDDALRRGPHVDLSGFRALKRILIHASFILPINVGVMSRGQIFTRLPKSLEWLQINFGNSPSIFGDVPVAVPSPFQYQWLFQFPNHKSRWFPRLKTVWLVDPVPTKGVPAMEPWELPVTLAKTLEEKGIFMGVMLRRWKLKWKPNSVVSEYGPEA